ncbi:MAG: ribonuclease P protein component [Planctomycetota bacterium]
MSQPSPAGEESPRLIHRRAHRVRNRRDFEAVYAAGVSKRLGPLLVHARPNGLGHARLGLAVPRRLGSAPRRNRIRRRIREAFRLLRPELPPLDLVVHVRPHDPLLETADLQQMLRRAAENLARRLEPREPPGAGGAGEPREPGP